MAGAEEAWRCFVAVSLAEPARSAVADYLAELRATIAGVAWARLDHLHLTLAFLGDVAPSRVPAVAARLRADLAAIPAFSSQVVGVGAFPNVTRPQVVWVGVTAPALGAVAEAVEGACAAEGFARERRPFRPHVTLGRVRVRSRRDAPDLAVLARDGARAFGEAPVRNVTLFRSELAAGGTRHSALAAFPLVE